MYSSQRFKKLSLLSMAPIAAASIWGGVALAGSSSATTNDGVLATISEQAAPAATSRADDFIAGLAAKLGISEQTLRDALKATSIDDVNEKLANGEITQEQADTAIARINESNGSFFGAGGRGGPHGHGPGGPGFVAKADLAAFLGIDEATLHTELEADGATLATVAAAHGKSRAELTAFLTDSFNTSIDEKVAAGDVTAEEAATRKEEFAANVETFVDQVHPPRGERGPRGFGGPSGGAPEDDAG